MDNETNLTNEQKVEEFKKCASNALYFIRNYCYIPHQKYGEILMGEFLYPKQEEFLRMMAEDRFVISNKTRQCLTEDNYVMTNRGYISIKDVKIGDKIETIGVNGKSTYVDVYNSFQNGKKETCRILTNSGSEINCTFDHLIQTKRGWVEAKDLTINDEVVSIISKGSFGNFTLKYDEQAALIGYYLADGRSNSPTFVNTNKEYVDEVLNIGKTVFENCNPYIYERKDGVNRLQAYDVRFVSGYRKINEDFMNFMVEYGLNVLSENRCLNKNLLDLNKKQMSILINRLYAGDGWITYKKDARRKNYIQYEIGFGSPSFKLIKQLEYIFQTKYGIHGYITKCHDRRNPDGKDFWKYRICQKKSVIKFINEIGIKGKTDTDEIKKLIEKESPYDSHQSFEKIRKIENKNIKEDVYDITTESSDFITNGLLVHNCGFSTAIGCFALWYGLFHINKSIVVVSITDQHSKEFLKKYVQYPYDRLPSFLKSKKIKRSQYQNAHELGLYTGSTIRCASGKNAARGSSNYIVIVDEVGFLEETLVKEIWSAVFPTIVTGEDGKVILNSTSSAAGTWYHDKWEAASQGHSEFKPIVVDWWEVPHLAKDPEYENNMRRELTPHSRFRREIMREFVVDEDPFIPLEFTERMPEDDPIRMDYLKPEDYVPPEKQDPNDLPTKEGFDPHKNYIKHLWIWKDPIKGHNYVLSADVAEGDGLDFSTIQVIDLTNNEQVAEFIAHVDTYTFADIIIKVAYYYNMAMIVPEANAAGNSVVSRLEKTFKYENLYYRPESKGMVAPGWKTTPGNRNDVLNAYYKALVQFGYITHSKRLKKETRSLITKKNKVQAAQGTHDDLIMAFSIGSYLIQQNAMYANYYNIEIASEVYDDDITNQSPQQIKEYLEQSVDVSIDNSDRYRYRWMYL